ncbi:MAG: ABC transporter permease [Dehalococcoidales bacterium]|nr:ABC transporter permease [Dehalococcoidales bacterium]
MTNYIVRRIIQTVVVLLLLTFISFSLLQIMPGDPAVIMLGLEADQAEIDALRKELWLDRPFVIQYGHWLANAVHGDLGNSITYREPVTDILIRRLPITFELSAEAFILSTILGILAGIFCAIRRGGVLDQLVSLFANIGIAIPVFWLGILCIYLFGLNLGWLPIAGLEPFFDDPGRNLKQSILPALMLAVPSIAVLARQTRSSMLEVVNQDYIRTAKSKGLQERIVVLKHALKNALIPVVTLLGLQVRLLVGGSVLVETVFNVPGMGRLLVASTFNKDFLIMQGGVLLIGAVVCLANLLVDISYGWLDPRVKYG